MRTSYEKNVKPFLDNIREWVGYLTTEQVARKLGISKSVLYKYINEHEELATAFEEGRKDLIEELKSTLKQKAKGFNYTERKTVTVKEHGQVMKETTEEYVKYSPPDTGAIHLLLKNIDDSWRNDDATTIRLKEEKMQIEREKTKEEW